MCDSTTVQIEVLLQKFRTGDSAAKSALINVAKERLLNLTSQLLGGFPRGREHDDTTGIFNESYLRLHEALDDLKPETVRTFLGLAALEIRRTLLDVVRKLSGRGKEKRGRSESAKGNREERAGKAKFAKGKELKGKGKRNVRNGEHEAKEGQAEEKAGETLEKAQ